MKEFIEKKSMTNEAILEFLKWAGIPKASAFDFDRPSSHAEARRKAGWFGPEVRS